MTSRDLGGSSLAIPAALQGTMTLPSRLGLLANLLLRHPAYLFSQVGSVYQRYESARLRVLQRRGLRPVLCMGGFLMLADPADANPGVSSSILLRGGLYEPESSDLLRRLLRPGDTVADIGANIGWYTLLAAKCVGAGGRVVACEPEPHNFRLLEASVRLNGLTNVTLVEKCVSDRSGYLTLNLSSTNAGGHSIVGSGEGSRSVKVDSVSLDDLCSQLALRRVDVIKIDAESAEPLVLLGSRGVLSRGDPRCVLMEYSPSAWRDYPRLLMSLFDEFSVHEVSRFSLNRKTMASLPKERQTMLLLLRK